MIEMEPVLKEDIVGIPKIEYEIQNSITLPNHNQQTSRSFIDVLENRHSLRELGFIDLRALGKLLYLSSRTKQIHISEDDLVIEKRNAPSAGALHTLDCIISNFDNLKWYIYNSKKHSLDQMLLKDISDLQFFKEECRSMLPNLKSGYLLWHVCDIERLGCKYYNPESLAIRESGALSAIQSLIAEELGLAFCMLGKLGYEVATHLSLKRKLIGTGTAVLGSRA